VEQSGGDTRQETVNRLRDVLASLNVKEEDVIHISSQIESRYPTSGEAITRVMLITAFVWWNK
jgi:hypothetical protein